MKILGLVLAICGAGAAVGQTGAPAKRAMTFADLMAMKRVSDPQISLSGKWVMFSVTDVSLEKNTKVNHLWVVALAGGGPERQATSNTGESFGRFSPDGKFVSYTGAGTKDDPVGRITIAAWDEATGTIGVGRTLKAVSGDADGAVWSPDSKHFLFTTEVWPECSVVGGAADFVHPTHDGGTVMDGAPGRLGAGGTNANTGVLRSAQKDNLNGVVGGTREVAGSKTAQSASWAEEDACDRAKDEVAEKSAVKGQVWEGLLYRHWDHYTGQKRTHVLVMDAEGAAVRDLTPASAVGDAEVPTFSLGGPLGYAWAPDSKEVAYVANLDAVPAASTNNDVFTLRVDEAGAKAVKVSNSPGSDDGPAYSPDGKWLAFRSQERAGFESDRFRLMLFDRGTKTIKEVLPKFDRWVDEFTWSPDSDRIYFASGDLGDEPIFRVKLDGTDLEQLNITGEYSDIHIAPKDSFITGVTMPGGPLLVAGRMSIAEPTKLVSIDLQEIHPLVDGPQPSKIPKQFLPTETDAAIRVDHEIPLTHLNDGLLSQLDLDNGVDEAESFRFAGAGGVRVQGFLLKPPGFDPAKKYPVKFLMHGGPQTAWGDSWSYRWNWELMAASGYVVIGINRRGSTGYGQKFIDEVSGDWGGRAYVDLMKGLDYAEAHYSLIDKTRECALGASYGGFMADWALTHTDRFKCIVTHDGMYDPVSAYGTTEEMWFNEWEFRRPGDFPKGWDGFGPTARKVKVNTEILTGGLNDERKANTGILRSAQNDKPGGRDEKQDGHAAEPWRYASLAADEDPFRKWSPMRFIENAKTPTLVIHSQKDYRLDVSQGFELFTALQRLGVASKMLYFPDEGHWVLKPQNSELWYETVGDWCDRWTKTGKYAEGQGTEIREQGTKAEVGAGSPSHSSR